MARTRTKKDTQLTLFRDPAEEIAEEIAKLDANALTPLQALEYVAKWRKRLTE
jgi:hypothetical protein